MNASVCFWCPVIEPDAENVYTTTCGESFLFVEDGPVENRFRFCPYCGGELKRLGTRAERREYRRARAK